MQKFFAWFKKYVVGDMQCAYIRKNRTAVATENSRMLIKLSILGTSLLAALTVFTFVAPFMERMRPLYLPYLIAYTIAHVMAVTFAKRNSICLKVGAYFLAFVTGAFGIELGVFYNPALNANLFMVFQIIMPLMFIEKPYALALASALAAIAFSVTTYLVKPTFLYQTDLVNCWVCYIISVITTRLISQARIENIDARRRLYSDTLTDELTQLHNRRGFNNRMQQVRDMIFDGSGRVVIFMLDIDNFKLYNDAYGHVAGDECLGELGFQFSQLAREYKLDFCRYGGEEFAAISTNPELDADAVGEEILRRVTELKIEHERSQYGVVTVSVGCADTMCAAVGSDIDLVNCADAALYEAKESGRNRYVKFVQD